MSLLESDAASPSTPTSSVEDESWLGELLVLGGGMLVALGALGAAVAWRSSRQMTALQRCEAEAQRLRGQPHNFTASECVLFGAARTRPWKHPIQLHARALATSPQPPRVVACTRRLLLYNGAHAEHPLLLAIKGRVLDVREGADYYGPDAPYKIMAGRDASKAFAMMSLKVEDAVSDLTGVPDNHLKILDDW